MTPRRAARALAACCAALFAVAALAQSPPPATAPNEAPPPLSLSEGQRHWLAEHPVLRVGVEQGWEPIEYLDEKGRYRGIVADWMALVSARLGVRFEYVHRESWEAVLADFEAGRIDVLAALTRTPERAQNMRFSRPYLNFGTGLIVRNDAPALQSLRDLPAGRLAVVPGFASAKAALARAPQLRAVEVSSTQEALVAVATNRADVTVATVLVAHHLAAKLGLANLRIGPDRDDYPEGLRVAVRPQLEPLVDMLDAVLDSVSPRERVAISERWVKLPATEENPPEGLGIQSSSSALNLTQEQRALLTRYPVLRLGVESNWPPVEYFDGHGQYSGVISSYMRDLEKRLGVRFELVRKDSWAEVLEAFDRGEIDVLSALGETEERRRTMRFSAPYINFTDGLIVRTDEPYVERLDEFPAGRRIAVVQGYGSNERAAANHPQLVVVPVRSTEEALFAVSSGRADIAVATLASAHQLIQREGLGNLRVAANFDEFEQAMGMAFQPALAPLVPVFNVALDSITPGERDSMRELWTKVPIDRGVSRQTVVLWTALALALLLLMTVWVLWLLSQQRRNRRLLQRAESAESQLRAVFDTVPATFWTLRVENSRPPVFTCFGSPERPENLLSEGRVQYGFEEGTRLLHAEDKERFQHLLERNGPTLTAFRLEYRVRNAQGAEGWAYMQAVPKRERGVLVWYGCTVDISERKQLEAALEQSRAQLEELAAGVPGALWQFRREPDGRQHYSYMSDGIVSITGRTPEETNQLMKDKSFVSVHPDDLAVLQALMKRLTEKPGIEEARYRLSTTGGGWKWVQVAARAMPVGEDGAIVWNGITFDATRNHEIEEALRLERQRLQDLADSFSGALWRMTRDADGRLRFDYISQGIKDLTGNTPEAVLSGAVNPLERIVEQDRARIVAALDHSADTLTALEVEFDYERLDGSRFRLALRAGVRLVGDRPVWTGVGYDTTERHRMAQALEEARGRIDDIAANFPGAIFQIARAHNGVSRFTYISDGITNLTGRPPRTSDGRVEFTDYNNIHPDDRVRVRDISDRMVEAASSAQFDYRLLDAEGQPRWVHCAMSARRQADGSTLINGLLLNAEEAKRLETELRGAREEAEAASRAKSRFLANMSHEIRTPMNAVIGLAHLAMTSATDPVQAERIGKVHNAGRALLKLLNDILEYSRLDARKVAPRLAPFDLRELKEALTLFCAPAAETKGLVFRIDCAADVPVQWLGDATRIQQVLLNLLTNAIKFTDSGGVRLVMQSTPGTAGLCFEVHDTGIGMTPDELARVFEAFEQASGDTERRHGGSGLGLSISKGLVEALGGQLQVQSVVGEGTVFRVELPFQPVAQATAPAARPQTDVLQRLARLSDHVMQRDSAAIRNTLQALRVVLIAQGQAQELHALERLLADFDFDGARIEMARLHNRWNGQG